MRLKLSAILVLLTFLAGVAQASGDREPNDSLNQAVPFRIGEAAGGSLLRPAADSRDCWLFTLERDAKVFLEISPAEGLMLGGAYIYGENKSSYTSFASQGDRRTFSGHLKGGRTYYVEINAAGSRPGSYTLFSRAEYPPHEAEREPNDSFDAASGHQLNSSSTGHLVYSDIMSTDSRDYWRFTLDKDAKVTLELAPYGELALGGAYIYNENKSSYGSFASAGPNKLFTGHLKGGRTYYVEINGAGGKGGSYTLHSRVAYPGREAEREPNDSFDTAANHTPNRPSYGHLLYTDIASTDSRDYWKFSLERDAKVTVEITPAEELKISSAYLYNENRSSYTSLAAKGDGRAATLYLQGGRTYYVEINGTSGGGSYTLSTAADYGAYASELKGSHDLNDDMGRATPLSAAVVFGHLGYTDIRTTDSKDFWTFNLAAERCIEIKAEPVEGELNIGSAYLYHGNRSTYQSFSAEGKGRALKQCLKPDTYYIELAAVNAGSYRLTVSGAGLPGEGGGGPVTVVPPVVPPIVPPVVPPAGGGRDLVANSGLKTSLCNWQVAEWHKPADGRGEVSFEAEGVRFRSLSGNTRIGIVQQKNEDVSRCRRLVLTATVKVERQTLTGTGWNGREAPVGVFVSYTDAAGTAHSLLSENPADPARMFWHGFYTLDPVPPSLAVHGTKVQPGSWYTFRTDLMTLSPRPVRLNYVGAEGAGWSPREGMIRELNLICEE